MIVIAEQEVPLAAKWPEPPRRPRVAISAGPAIVEDSIAMYGDASLGAQPSFVEAKAEGGNDPQIVRRLLQVLPLLPSELASLHIWRSYAWAKPLDEAERAEMRRELLIAASQALQQGDWTGFDDALHRWQRTAFYLQSEDVVAELLAPRDCSQEVELRRP